MWKESLINAMQELLHLVHGLVADAQLTMIQGVRSVYAMNHRLSNIHYILKAPFSLNHGLPHSPRGGDQLWMRFISSTTMWSKVAFEPDAYNITWSTPKTIDVTFVSTTSGLIVLFHVTRRCYAGALRVKPGCQWNYADNPEGAQSFWESLSLTYQN